MIIFWVYTSFFQGQSQSGGHGPGGGKKDDKVNKKPDISVMWVNCGEMQLPAELSGDAWSEKCKINDSTLM